MTTKASAWFSTRWNFESKCVVRLRSRELPNLTSAGTSRSLE